MKSGIYKIMNTITNEIYVGSTIDLEAREIAHAASLLNNKHHNTSLQLSFNQYGIHSFIFEILEYCKEDRLREQENHYLQLLKPDFNYSWKSNQATGDKVWVINGESLTIVNGERRFQNWNRASCDITEDQYQYILLWQKHNKKHTKAMLLQTALSDYMERNPIKDK